MYSLGATSFLRNNTPAHTKIILICYFAENQIAVSFHLSYSPDFVPSDYFSISKTRIADEKPLLTIILTDILTIQYQANTFCKIISPDWLKICVVALQRVQN